MPFSVLMAIVLASGVMEYASFGTYNVWFPVVSTRGGKETHLLTPPNGLNDDMRPWSVRDGVRRRSEGLQASITCTVTWKKDFRA